MKKINKIQQEILKFAESNALDGLSLRKIAEKIGEKTDQPQQIRHHIMQLEKKGLICFDRHNKIIRRTASGSLDKSGLLVSIPIAGAANCGQACAVAEQNIEGYLKISKRFLPTARTKGIFAIRAIGSSMNKAKISGGPIEDGDFVIVDGNYVNFHNGDYILSVIDGLANIKKIIKEKDKITLLSESTENIPPIYIHPEDSYLINGKVIQVIKKPKID